MKSSELIQRIKNQCEMCADGRPPFTLIVGSGFSYPLIPTTSAIVREDLPWWDWCQRNTSSDPKPEFGDVYPEEEAKQRAAEFWKRVKQSDIANSFKLADDGLPTKETLTEAYKLVLSPSCTDGLGTPDRVRRYFLDVVARVGNRLNPAHLYAASLIAEKPELFGTVFTTNFDPLLQRALQLVNVSYFVSDRPDTMQHLDDDNVQQAVHLVHAHGSIYRYLLLNTPEEIEEYANRNKSLLEEYFRKHGVLIVGYSGWDDSITRALDAVEKFAHNLYWCDPGPSFDVSGLSQSARDILEKHNNAFYVPIESANDLMVKLHQELTGHALPQLFRDPLVTVQSELDRCDLRGVKIRKRADADNATTRMKSSGAARDTASSTGESDFLNLGDQVTSIKKRLNAAQRIFEGETAGSPEDDQQATLAAQVQQRFAVGTDLYFSGKYDNAIPHLNFVVEHAHVLDPAERARTQIRRGVAYSWRAQKGDIKRAIADFSAVIDMADARDEQRAKARLSRGIAYLVRRQEGHFERAIADFNAVIEMADARDDQRANARINRGVAYGRRGQKNDINREIADYSAVIDMADTPADERTLARLNRGITYLVRRQKGDIKGAIADFSALIDMADAPAGVQEQASKLLAAL